MIGLAMSAALAAASPIAPQASCAITRPMACRDTNALAISPGFSAAIARFVGTRRADFLYRGGRVATQAVDVLHGPPDDPVRVGSFYRFTACRAHSCPEKGALVVTPTGRIVAVAILHSTCALPGATSACTGEDVLDVYVRGAPPAVIDSIAGWARDAVAKDYHLPTMPPTRLVKIRITRV